MKICIITSARNEEKYLKSLAQCIINQTSIPTAWYIVDDGSTDMTPKIAAELSSQYNWIKVIHLKDRGFDSRGKGSIQAHLVGINDAIQNISPDIIGIIDADITIENDFIERALNIFDHEPRIGILGGEILELKNDKWVRPIDIPPVFVRGACKMYRYNCYKDIGGIKVINGWSSIDNMLAQMCGWISITNETLPAKHHRPKGVRDGIKDHIKSAKNAYYMNMYPQLVVARGLRRMIKEKPYFIGGFIFTTTFFILKFKRANQFPDTEL